METSLEPSERRAAIALLAKSTEDFSVLSPLIEDEDVNDILVSRYDDISIQSGRVNTQTDICFPSHSAYLAFIDRVLSRSGKSCNHATPVVDVAINGQLRACITHESFSPPSMGPTMTIRIARHRSITAAELCGMGLAPREVMEYLRVLVSAGICSLLVSGEVGTGKTTLVRALASHIEPAEALLIIEDTQEIVLERQFCRTLLTRVANSEGFGSIRPSDAIRAGMRMAMNRIILGEMRDAGSAEAFIDVATSGHSGLSTIHANSARDALSRLELLLLRAQVGIGAETARRQIAQAIGVLIHIRLCPESGERRISEVVEVHSCSEGVIQLMPIFQYVPNAEHAKQLWKVCSRNSQYREALSRADYRFPSLSELLCLSE